MFGNTEHTIWVERYRPDTLDTLIGNEHLKEKVKRYISTNDIPHLLLQGRPGCGKTTVSRIIANTIECDYLYINASDENSIDVMRNKIKNFVSSAGFKPLKVVILDESDFLSIQSLGMLRNLLEVFSMHARFILTCNYVERIIEPIQSRCQIYTMTAPSRKEVAIHCSKILQQENIKFSIEDVATIVNACYPDIRRTINTLQQQSINGQLTIDKQSLLEANYLTKLLEVLKGGADKKSRLTEARQIIVDSQVQNFADFYTFMYENVEQFSKGNIASGIIILAEYQFMDSSIPDHQLNTAACIAKLINEL